jgi:hypothetical protein
MARLQRGQHRARGAEVLTALTISLPDSTEKATQHAIKKLFKAAGCQVYSTSQVRRSMVSLGLPDLWVFVPRRKRAFWFEVKRPAGKLRKEQDEFRLRCEATGVAYHWGCITEAIVVLQRLGLAG